MFWLYNCLLFLTAFFWLPYLYLHSRKRKPGPIWRERFGNYSVPPVKDERRIWIHAVSVGEVLAAKPILEQIRLSLPDHKIILSVTTSSGHETASGEQEKRVSSGKKPLYDHLIYFPIDVVRFTLSAVQQIRPEVIGLMETELWWNFLWAAKTMDAEVLVLNGRISDRSFPRMMRLRLFYKGMLKLVDRCLMQTQTDGDRIVDLGAKNVQVLGNCKFDEAAPVEKLSKQQWRHKFGLHPNFHTLVIGSTRGEAEELLICEFLQLLPAGVQDRLQIVHAPRHIERAAKIMEIATLNGWHPVSRSSGDPFDGYLVLDTYGELASVYGAADIAIVGGGFDNLGGQNLIQPLAHGVPVVHGPHMQNFRDVAVLAAKAHCALTCATATELADTIRDLFQDKDRLHQMSESALKLVEANKGASQRFVTEIASAAEIAHQRDLEWRARTAARRAEIAAQQNKKSKTGNTQGS